MHSVNLCKKSSILAHLANGNGRNANFHRNEPAGPGSDTVYGASYKNDVELT